MLNLLRAEWLKLSRRPLAWVLLAIFLVLFVLQVAVQLVLVLYAQPMLDAAQYEEYRRRLAFPGVFGTVFAHINGLGGIFAMILAAGAVGSEYSWGTLRTHLARYPQRAHYLIAKLLALLLVLLVGMVITLALGTLIGLLTTGLVGGGGLELGALALLPLACLRALYIFLPYILITVCFAVWGRSLLAGVAGGMFYLVLDLGVGAAVTLAKLGGAWQLAYSLIIQGNINALAMLNTRMFGLRPEAISQNLDLGLLPSPLQATLVVGLYCALFLATALHFLRSRDISGPS